MNEWDGEMLKIAIELSIEKAGEIVSGLEILTKMPSVKVAADQIEKIKSQIDDLEASQLNELSSEFLAKVRNLILNF